MPEERVRAITKAKTERRGSIVILIIGIRLPRDEIIVFIEKEIIGRNYGQVKVGEYYRTKT